MDTFVIGHVFAWRFEIHVTQALIFAVSATALCGIAVGVWKITMAQRGPSA